MRGKSEGSPGPSRRMWPSLLLPAVLRFPTLPRIQALCILVSCLGVPQAWNLALVDQALETPSFTPTMNPWAISHESHLSGPCSLHQAIRLGPPLLRIH